MTYNGIWPIFHRWVELGWVGLGWVRNISVSVGWVEGVMGWVGLGYENWTHVHVWGSVLLVD